MSVALGRFVLVTQTSSKVPRASAERCAIEVTIMIERGVIVCKVGAKLQTINDIL
jgi:hypothetical protein